MKPPEEAKRDLVRQWVLKAEQDFALAQHLIAEQAPYLEAIGFNAQQSAEKYLKAFLVRHQLAFPKTHNLSELLRLVAGVAPSLAGSLREIIALNPYGVDIRYPGDFPEISADAAKAAFALAAKVRTSVLAFLDPYLQEP